MNNIELKVCPFCGGKVEFINKRGYVPGNDEWDIHCTTEGCFLEKGAGYTINDKDYLAELWNNRKHYVRRKVKLDLRECPFCGGETKIEKLPHGGFYISCENKECFLNGHEVGPWKKKEHIIEAFNKRVIDSGETIPFFWNHDAYSINLLGNIKLSKGFEQKIIELISLNIPLRLSGGIRIENNKKKLIELSIVPDFERKE